MTYCSELKFAGKNSLDYFGLVQLQNQLCSLTEARVNILDSRGYLESYLPFIWQVEYSINVVTQELIQFVFCGVTKP